MLDRCAIAVALVALAPSLAAGGEIDSGRAAQLERLVHQDCGSCHGMTMKGGLGSPLLPATLQHVEDAAIAGIVLDGVPGTPMPPWRGLLSDSEAQWIARALKAGVLK